MKEKVAINYVCKEGGVRIMSDEIRPGTYISSTTGPWEIEEFPNNAPTARWIIKSADPNYPILTVITLIDNWCAAVSTKPTTRMIARPVPGDFF